MWEVSSCTLYPSLLLLHPPERPVGLLLFSGDGLPPHFQRPLWLSHLPLGDLDPPLGLLLLLSQWLSLLLLLLLLLGSHLIDAAVIGGALIESVLKLIKR